MSSFEDVKVGDKVLISESVPTGWGSQKSFWITKEVTKVTKTQFTTADGTRAKKDTGSVIGEYATVRSAGEPVCGNDRVYLDESKEMGEFKRFQQVILKSRRLSKEIAHALSDTDAYDMDPGLAGNVLLVLMDLSRQLTKTQEK